MPKCIHLDPKVQKNFEILCRSGKKAALSVSKSQEIISRLRCADVSPGDVGTPTRHGEARIKGLKKYDLGSGYRLITFRHGDDFFVLYIGSHDDCHRWIENNRELTVDQVRKRCTAIPVGEEKNESSMDEDMVFHYEEDIDPLAEISENDIRQIFCGLVDSVS